MKQNFKCELWRKTICLVGNVLYKSMALTFFLVRKTTQFAAAVSSCAILTLFRRLYNIHRIYLGFEIYGQKSITSCGYDKSCKTKPNGGNRQDLHYRNGFHFVTIFIVWLLGIICWKWNKCNSLVQYKIENWQCYQLVWYYKSQS